MSSSLPDLSGRQGFGLVQSGIVAWEASEPVVDWSSKTLSVVVRKLDLLCLVLRGLLYSGLDCFRYATRLHVAPLPDRPKALQVRRILLAMQHDPPGMQNTVVEAVGNTHAYVISEITNPQQVELDYLTSSRTTVIVASANQRDTMALVRSIPGVWNGFDSGALHALREGLAGACLIRSVDMETHCVLQVIGDSDLVSQIWTHLDRMGLRRVLGPREVPLAIERLI